MISTLKSLTNKTVETLYKQARAPEVYMRQKSFPYIELSLFSLWRTDVENNNI